MAHKNRFNAALANPAGIYATPNDVLADDSLDTDQKRAVLIAWAKDADALLRADGENMPADDPDASAARTLQQIEQARFTLEA